MDRLLDPTRRLVEQDEVLMLFGSLGTASNLAVQKYLNANKVPQLFLITGVGKLSDPERFPWTMGFVPSYQLEGATYARHPLETRPEAKVALLYQNDDYGKDLRKGFREALAGKAPSMTLAVSADPSVSIADRGGGDPIDETRRDQLQPAPEPPAR